MQLVCLKWFGKVLMRHDSESENIYHYHGNNNTKLEKHKKWIENKNKNQTEKGDRSNELDSLGVKISLRLSKPHVSGSNHKDFKTTNTYFKQNLI